MWDVLTRQVLDGIKFDTSDGRRFNCYKANHITAFHLQELDLWYSFFVTFWDRLRKNVGTTFTSSGYNKSGEEVASFIDWKPKALSKVKTSELSNPPGAVFDRLFCKAQSAFCFLRHIWCCKVRDILSVGLRSVVLQGRVVKFGNRCCKTSRVTFPAIWFAESRGRLLSTRTPDTRCLILFSNDFIRRSRQGRRAPTLPSLSHVVPFKGTAAPEVTLSSSSSPSEQSLKPGSFSNKTLLRWFFKNNSNLMNTSVYIVIFYTIYLKSASMGIKNIALLHFWRNTRATGITRALKEPQEIYARKTRGMILKMIKVKILQYKCLNDEHSKTL